MISYALAIVGIAHLLRHRRSPGATLAWLMVFVGLPLVGSVLYLMFGGRKLRTQRRIAQTNFDATLPLARKPCEFAVTLRSYGAAPVTAGNQVVLCKGGVAGYRRMVELIEQGEHRICLATFIFAHDDVGRDILRRLVRGANNGIDVKVLVDGLGSMQTPRRFFRELVDAGGRYAVFQPVIHLPFRTITNLRNHRKILVADGRRSFAGGMNITGEDIYPEPTAAGSARPVARN